MQPLPVALRSVLPLPVDEAPTPEELEHVKPGLEKLPLKGLLTANQTPHPLLGFRRDPDHHRLARPVQTGDLAGVLSVVLPAVPGRVGISEEAAME